MVGFGDGLSFFLRIDSEARSLGTTVGTIPITERSQSRSHLDYRARGLRRLHDDARSFSLGRTTNGDRTTPL